MLLLTYMTQHYFGIAYERFTDKIIAALALFKVMEKFKPADYERVKYIEQSTNEDIEVSIYKLDRNINPTKGDFKTTSVKITFNQNKPTRLTDDKYEDKGKITLTEDEIQYYLCCAIREIHDIICTNLSGYGEEVQFPKPTFKVEGEGGEDIFGSLTTKKEDIKEKGKK